jgi:hypothetical protein
VRKPEIVKIGGFYAVRKKGLFGYKFRNRWDTYWWSDKGNVYDYCVVKTLPEAKKLLQHVLNPHGIPLKDDET